MRHQGEAYTLKWVDNVLGEKSNWPSRKTHSLEQRWFSAPGLRLRDKRRGHEVERRLSHASGNVSIGACLERTCTARALRWVYTTLPEGHEHAGKLAPLAQSMSGTQDAASIWSDTWETVSSHVLRHIRVRRNVTRSVPWRRLGAEFGDLRTHCDERQTGHIGFASDWGPSLRVLNRTISINIELDIIVLEPDQCYVSKMVEELGLADSKSMNTPRLKPDLEAHLQTGSAKTLEPETATSLKTEWTDRNQWSSNVWLVTCLAIFVALWCSPDSRQRVQISKCMWVQIELETWKVDGARRG